MAQSHARKVQATAVKSSGGFTRKALGYVCRCACGWNSSETFEAQAIKEHKGHKADVASGKWAADVAAEKVRRAEVYRALLADQAALSATYLTTEQVEAMLAEVSE